MYEVDIACRFRFRTNRDGNGRLENPVASRYSCSVDVLGFVGLVLDVQ